VLPCAGMQVFEYSLRLTAGGLLMLSCPPFLPQDFPSTGQAQQVSTDITGLLSSIASLSDPNARRGPCISYEDAWRLIRPLLRVLLWLLPEHVTHAASVSATSPSVAYIHAVATVGDGYVRVPACSRCSGRQ
jgi:hypothetical protein